MDDDKYFYTKNGTVVCVELTEEDKSAYNQWISGDYYTINDKLRRGLELSKEEQQKVDSLNKALSKLPRYKSKDGEPIFRALQIPDYELQEFLNKYPVGRTFESKSYYSFSTEWGYNDKANVYIAVYNCQKPKSLLDRNKKESEVIYPIGTSFTITDKKYEKGKYYFIYKEE